MKVLSGCLLFFVLFRPIAWSQPPASRLVKWLQMEKLLSDPCDSLTVINFWATWCRPCVQELPHFEKARKSFSGRPLRFVFVSLDFAEEQKTRLDPFVHRKLPGAQVWLLDETNYNDWIDRISPEWSGAIPATLIVNNSKKIRIFATEMLSEPDLFRIIESNLPPRK
jgi:thiol-disulfide isomerase/thioredoxin